MAEVKNAFIKSKMNKDLDARLIPSGEYRDAINVQISKSEGDDVGALENILGNATVSDFTSLMEDAENQECIGYFASEFNSTVYLFFTNNVDNYNGGRQAYNPSAKNYIIQFTATGNNQGVSKKLVQGAFLNFSKNRPIIGVNLLENLLFFTDNRNQPRKINVSLAADRGVTYYTSEDNISVAKYFPYQAIEVIKEILPGVYETTMKDVFSANIPINETSYLDNPYYNEDFPGDPKYLEDKFVRFSYRFKFEDGEYSLLAPFTQACFIPKQDGYFLQGDEQQTVASTIVEFMENKVNQISLQVPLPLAGNNLRDGLKITELDIIYKESDALAIQVVDTVSVSDIAEGAGSSNVFEFIYNSTKPFKTLPSNETPRVYDKVPVRALSQEIISNRVVYGNFQDKHTPPSGIKYQVAASEKYSPTDAVTSRSSIEYPNHSVKENRNYQVGIVLADRYGRQSSVILSSEISESTDDFGADTVYLNYSSTEVGYGPVAFRGNSLKILFNEVISSTKSELTGQPGLYVESPLDSDYNPTGWYTYKIVVKQIEQEYYNVYAPGAMKGIPYYSTSNPIVPLTEENASFITLLNDNINKVPRDLSEVGPQDKQFRSSVRLFGRVQNTEREFSNIGNRQYIPTNERQSFTTNTIEDLFDLFDTTDFLAGNNSPVPITSTNNPYSAFYRAESNPFIAEFITSQTSTNQFGVNNIDYGGSTNTVYEKFENLAVLETAPTVSRLDIFYESSTSGLISELNASVGGSSGATGIRNFNYFHTEGFDLDTDLTGDFVFVDVLNDELEPNSVSLESVVDGTGADRTSDFRLVPNTPAFSYKLQNTEYFYYGQDANTAESYTFTFRVQTTVDNETITRDIEAQGFLQNVTPTINNTNTDVIVVDRGASSIPLAGDPNGNLNAVNGSADDTGSPPKNTVFADIALINPTGNGTFSLQGLSVVNSDSNASGIGSFTIRVLDEGGLPAQKTFNVRFGQPEVDPSFRNIQEPQLIDGDGVAYWFTNNFNNLTNDTPNNVFGQAVYLTGFEAPSSADQTITNNICTSSNPSGVLGSFYNKTTSTGLTQGAFYVQIVATNNKIVDSNNQEFPNGTNVNIRHFIQYRDPNGASYPNNWTTATDIRDVNIDNAAISGTAIYQNAFASGNELRGFASTNNNFQVGTGINVNVKRAYTGTSELNGGKVYVFDRPGDYRVIVGNIQSDYGFFTTNKNCSAGQTQDYDAIAELYINDFYNSDGQQNGVYEYQIASNSTCSNSFSSTGVTYYAEEMFAKYLTQLYTDSNLTQPANINGTQRFRLVENTNPEYTKDRAYVGNFSNGLLSSEPDPCLYTT